jgi:hypothetical protein
MADHDALAGLETRYLVARLGDEETKAKHKDCRYFVLDPMHDRIAREVLLHYAAIAKTRGMEPLAEDIFEWMRSTRYVPSD